MANVAGHVGAADVVTGTWNWAATQVIVNHSDGVGLYHGEVDNLVVAAAARQPVSITVKQQALSGLLQPLLQAQLNVRAGR